MKTNKETKSSRKLNRKSCYIKMILIFLTHFFDSPFLRWNKPKSKIITKKRVLYTYPEVFRSTFENQSSVDLRHGTKSPVFWWFYQTVNVLKMPRSRSVFSFRNSQGKLGVHNPLTPGKYAVYFTFSSTRKTWLNSALSLVNRTFYQTVNVRKISRSWLVFQLRKRQGQLGNHHLTEVKYAVHVTLSSTWKTGLNSSFSLVNRKFYQTVNVVKIKRS